VSDFQKQYALWDEFLSVWPASRLATMTLDEYTQAGSKDSFTYWKKVRGFVVPVADWAAQGDLNAIESFEHLGEAFNWKIAFHYQNRQMPVIVDIFKRAPLAVFVSGTASQSMAALQQATVAKRPGGLGILEFGRQVWEAWSQKNLAIWKLPRQQPAANWPVHFRSQALRQGRRLVTVQLPRAHTSPAH